MPRDYHNTTYFRQARFTARLPNQYLYSPAHYWLVEREPGTWRVGLTRFATRMLGDFVELTLDVAPSDLIAVGETMGGIEGFKAVTDVYSPLAGAFYQANPRLALEPHVVDVDPHGDGWLFEARGTPAGNLLDVTGYVEVLQLTIDKMLADQKKSQEGPC